jgi:hypothetical protein
VTIGVSIVPGQTALIRIPRGAYSNAALVVSPITPCFEALPLALSGIMAAACSSGPDAKTQDNASANFSTSGEPPAAADPDER